MGTYLKKQQELEEKKRSFIERGGTDCILCGKDEDIQWEDTEMGEDGETIEINVFCDKCNIGWTNVYRIWKVENFEEDE